MRQVAASLNGVNDFVIASLDTNRWRRFATSKSLSAHRCALCSIHASHAELYSAVWAPSHGQRAAYAAHARALAP